MCDRFQCDVFLYFDFLADFNYYKFYSDLSTNIEFEFKTDF